MSAAVLPDDHVFQPGALSDDQVFAHPAIHVPAAVGASTSVTTASGDEVDGRFAVLHAGDVTASHDVNMRPNARHQDAVDAEPRERADMEQRAQHIATNLDPRRLADSLHADEGAPVVGPDGVVEAGNARAIALQRIQRLPGEKAQAYKSWLVDNAQAFGLDPEDVAAIEKPMLVRVRSTPTDRAGVGKPLTGANFEPVVRSAADELASQLRDGGHVRVDDADQLHPETRDVLSFLAEHADKPDTIDAVLKAAKGIIHGKPSEDAIRRDDGKDAPPDQHAGSEPEAAPGDQGGNRGDAPSGPAKGVEPEWQAFGPETGTMGVPREHMPQILQEHRGALTQFLLARGIPHDQAEVAPEELRPTQTHWSPAKVAAQADQQDGDRAVLVSSDGHVLDGHHSWLSNLASGRPVRVIRFAAPILDLIDEAKQFPSAKVAEDQ